MSASQPILAGRWTRNGQLADPTTFCIPIVRRVFGGLVTNELTERTPFSLPIGLLLLASTETPTPK